MTSVQLDEQGSVTTPAGFLAGAIHAGVKYDDPERLDVGLLFSERPCAAAAMFTRSTVPGAPVIVSREHIRAGRARAIVTNSGVANVATGEAGIRNARTMCEAAARKLGIEPDELLVGSTGVIGWTLPIEKICAGIAALQLERDGGSKLARAIMTTDTRPKHVSASFEAGGRRYHVGGVAKGSGMIHPDMATMFGFVTTDAPVAAGFVDSLFRPIVDETFNMMSVDGDTSTSDTVVLLANGAGGGDAIGAASPAATPLREAVFGVSHWLARALAADGEGATKLIEVRISGARSAEEARRAARTITASPLVKTAIYGNDFNWGRILMAIGRSGAAIDLARATVAIGDVLAYRAGEPQSPPAEVALAALRGPEVVISADLGVGDGRAVGWGCDMTEEYIRINAEYTT